MPRLPGWMGALPNLAYLQLDEVALDAWSFAGFKSLQSLDISSCDVADSSQLHLTKAHSAKASTQCSSAQK